MTTESRPRFKITYATLRNDNEELHAAFEAGLEEAKHELGGHHRNFIDGLEREAQAETTVASPIDRDLILGHFAKGSRSDVQEAVDAARRAQPAWAATPWRDRLALIRKAAELISERQMRYAGLMAIEVGKNRLEALGEVEEAADLLRYYSQTMEDNGGYDHPMDNLGDGAVHTRSILRPHGVFAVISPFNFPMALAAGPTAAALIAGNTVVFKPSSAAPMSGVKLIEAYRDAGIPDGVVNLVMGPGDTVGAELRENPGIDGIVFTGSYDVGMDLFRTFSLDVPQADDRRDGRQEPRGRLAQGGPRGGGRGHHPQRVRLRWPEVLGELAGLRREAGPRRAGEAPRREDRGDHDRRPAAPRELAGPDRRPARGRPPPAGGRRGAARRPGLRRRRAPDRRGMDRGYYVEPTVVGDLPADHRLFRDEIFAPFTAVHASTRSTRRSGSRTTPSTG